MALTSCGAPGAPTAGGQDEAVAPVKPSSPITLTLLDGAGNVVVNRAIYDNFAKAHPELLPGMLAAGILVLVRTLGAFELTFFVSSAQTQTLVVALFGAISDPGGVPISLTAAMAVTYMLVAVLGLAISLRYVTPSQAIRQRHR